MRLSEVYTSIQGEGPRMGIPTTFVRFGGCNLRCPGWGQGKLPDGTVVDGCDTIFAVYPHWRHTWESISVPELLAKIPLEPQNICITGGEPLIQPVRQINELCSKLLDRGHTIDLFTNGTRSLYLYQHWVKNRTVIVVMDYKLPGSGEYESFNKSNWEWLQYKDALKFVCKNRKDLETAREVLKSHPELKASPWFGPVWGTDPETIIEFQKEQAPETRLNLQLHKYLWDPEERRR